MIERFAVLGRCELDQRGGGGRLYLEGPATAFAVHLVRSYSLSARRRSVYKGGLAPAQLHRVIEYVGHISVMN